MTTTCDAQHTNVQRTSTVGQEGDANPMQAYFFVSSSITMVAIQSGLVHIRKMHIHIDP